MDFPSAINLGASLVTIIGTTLTITQALRHKPSAYQQDGSALPRYAPQAPSHGVAPPKASPSVLQGRRPILRTGIGYGVGLSIALSIVYLTGNWLVDLLGWEYGGPTPQQWALMIVTLVAMASLFIAAGLVPARLVGSVAPGLLAGVILTVACDVAIAVGTLQSAPATNLMDNIQEAIFPALIGLAFSVIFAFLGRWAYNRAASHRGAAAARGAL